MSTKIFPHRVRKLRPTRGQFQPRGLIITDDPTAHRLRIEAERAERNRIEAGRRERMRERHQTRQAPVGDAEWFAARPERSNRVRRVMDGEIPQRLDPSHWKWMAVRQLAPGMRLRRPFNVAHGEQAMLHVVSTEQGARMMFDTVALDPKAEALR